MSKKIWFILFICCSLSVFARHVDIKVKVNNDGPLLFDTQDVFSITINGLDYYFVNETKEVDAKIERTIDLQRFCYNYPMFKKEYSIGLPGCFMFKFNWINNPKLKNINNSSIEMLDDTKVVIINISFYAGKPYSLLMYQLDQEERELISSTLNLELGDDSLISF